MDLIPQQTLLPGSRTPQGVNRFETLSSLLASPPAGRATALDAPGSMLYEVGGLWWGELKTPIAFASLPTLADGSAAMCPRLVGDGSYRVKRVGGLWRVDPGECVVMGAGPGANGYTLTAAGTSNVQLDTCIVPASLIKVGEIWAVNTHALKTTHVSGSDVIIVRFGERYICNSSPIPAAVGFHVGNVDISWINPTVCQRRLSPSRNNDGQAGGPDVSSSIADDTALSLAVTPGGAGNVITVHHWSLRRIA